MAPFASDVVRISTPPSMEGVTSQLADATAHGSLDDKLRHLGVNNTDREVMRRIRHEVLTEVESKISEKQGQMWQKGQSMMHKMQQQHHETAAELNDGIHICQERVRGMEADNAKLKETLTKLEQHFGKIGSMFNVARSSFDATGQFSPSSTRENTAFSTPSLGASRFDVDHVERKLAEIPPFPGSGLPQISLAEALVVPQTTQRVALSLNETLGTADPTLAGVLASASDVPAKTFSFSFTIRKADGMQLGLDVSHIDEERVLNVVGVRSNGAVEAWNRQCAGNPAQSDKAVRKGDKIFSVNGVTHDPDKMLEECRDRRLLKLLVYRPSEVDTVNAATMLRAEAPVFQPGLA